MEGQLILDRYRPLSELGEGGYGSVTLAWDTRMQRRVAIKRLALPLDSLGRPQQPPGLSEARTAAMLNHPAIVTVFDFDTDSDEAFLVMEHVDGASVADVLSEADGPLDLDEVAAICSAVGDALSFAHDNGVLHLDIKPANVLITRDGRVKVADFGMSALSSMTGHGPAFGGTPGYMPIEQLEGQHVSARTDEWALAATLYECLTAENPFAAATIEDAIEAIELYEPAPPSSLERSLPVEVDDVLLAALGPRPADRYPSVGAFVEQLEPHLGDARTGRETLAERVEIHAEEEPEPDESLAAIGLWDRLQGATGSVLLRAIAAIEAGWLAWAGLTPLPLDPAARLAATGLVAGAAALAPGLGTGLGLIAFAAGLFAAGAWLIGGAFLLGATLWWWFAARKSSAAAVLPLAAPILGVAWVAPATPLLAGFALAPLEAAGAAVAGAALSMLAAAMSSAGAPFVHVDFRLFVSVWDAALSSGALKTLGASPAPIAVLVAWPVAAMVMSMASRRASRAWAFVGAIAGAAALLGGYLAAHEIARLFGDAGASQWIGIGSKAGVGGSLILMLLVTALGAPVRGEEDSPTRSREIRRDEPDETW